MALTQTNKSNFQILLHISRAVSELTKPTKITIRLSIHVQTYCLKFLMANSFVAIK